VRSPTPDDAAERQLLLNLIELGWGQDSPAYRQVFATRAIPGAPSEALASYCAIQRASATPKQAQRLTQLFWHIDVTALLPQLRCPVLVLHARRDDLVPFSQGQLLAQRIEGSRFVALDSANHDLLADEPAWPVLAEAIRTFLSQHAGNPLPRDGRDMTALTTREREVLEQIARGLDNEEIASVLFMSEKTVRNNVSAIFAKLDFSSRGRLIVWARDAGLGRQPAG
jgi:DNA-binding NarL/FixJ family response regulator